MPINKIGHFYFGKSRTFLNWLDQGKVDKFNKKRITHTLATLHFAIFTPKMKNIRNLMNLKGLL